MRRGVNYIIISFIFHFFCVVQKLVDESRTDLYHFAFRRANFNWWGSLEVLISQRGGGRKGLSTLCDILVSPIAFYGLQVLGVKK